jgi:hypothetical protein
MAKAPTKTAAKSADTENKTKSSLSSQELEDLKTLGYVEGNPSTIPDNISPVLKAKILEDYRQNNPRAGAPNAIETQNDAVRERAAADEAGEQPKVKRQNEIE